MPQKQNQHVVRIGTGWGVRAEGSNKLTASYPTQRQAIKKARMIAEKQDTEALVHGRDGKVRPASIYDQDPFPFLDKAKTAQR